MTGEDERAELLAKQRFLVTNLVRIGSLAATLSGIAILQDALAAPTWLGAALTLLGVGGFFFAPALLARHWKDQDGNFKA